MNINLEVSYLTFNRTNNKLRSLNKLIFMKKALILISLLIITSFPIYSQGVRINNNGQKLVKSLKTTFLDAEKKPVPYWDYICKFYYDDGNLVKVVRNSTDYNKHQYKEVLTREGNELKYLCYVDNKLQNIESKILLDDENKLSVSLRKVAAGTEKFANVTKYSDYDIEHIDFNGLFKISDIEENLKSDTWPLHHFRSGPCYTQGSQQLSLFNLFKLGVIEYLNFFLIGEDNYLYYPRNYEIENYHYYKGNPVTLYKGLDLSKVNGKYAFPEIYSKRQNDLNINIFGLSKHNVILGGPYEDLEYLTEWFPIRSNNLLEGIGHNGMDPKFEYIIDENDNIRQILITVDIAFARRYITVDIEYEK